MAKQQPVHEEKLGLIRASIWKNNTAQGVRFNVTLGRLYRDGTQWKTSESFGRDDLPLVEKVCDRAHSWIFAQVQEEKRDGSNAEAK